MFKRTIPLRNNSPISAAEFYNALRAAWSPQGAWSSHKKQRLGLAISGGVDSLALAVLCAKLQSDHSLKLPFDFVYRAFIVDHKARDGSSEEANLVARKVGDILGTKPNVLTLKWPPNVQHSTLPNFESEARHLRYRALGKACLDHGVQSLLLAHHEDDQAETVLLRLANGHRGKGLQGMGPSSAIPECWGLHGIYQSGDRDHLIMKRRRQEPAFDANGEHNHHSLLTENGGIRVHRPLLPFPKSRLVESCRAANVQWVEDKTNHDPTFTARNAVRQIMSSRDLPVALQKQSLLSLAASMQSRFKAREGHADALISKCHRILDIRSGKLIIHIPTYFYSANAAVPPEYRIKTYLDYFHKASLFLKRLIEAVSPQEIIHLRNLQSATKAIFPTLRDQTTFDNISSGVANDTSSPNIFTTCGVHFRRLDPSQPQHHPSQSTIKKQIQPYKQTWELTRQPYPTSLATPRLNIPSQASHNNNNRQKKNKLQSQPTRPPNHQLNPPFHLWDGRYWIRIHNHSSQTLLIRPFSELDMRPLRLSLVNSNLSLVNSSQQVKLEEILKQVAPGKTRWTLPVIATAGGDGPEGLSPEGLNGNGKVIALPTLDIVVSEEWREKVRWEVRYKKVELGLGERLRVVG